MLERPQGGDPNRRVLRYSLPSSVRTSSGGVSSYRSSVRALGTSEEAVWEATKNQVRAVLSPEGLEVTALAEKSDLTANVVRTVLAELPNEVIREGKGVRESPHLYRRRDLSLLAQPASTGEETNQAGGAGEPPADRARDE